MWNPALKRVGGELEKLHGSTGKTRPRHLVDVNGLCRQAIELIPAAVYMTDAEGRISFYNEAAVALWGCRPEPGKSKFCGSWKLYWPDGTPLPHDECPMAMALRQQRPIRGMEAVAERPDGKRIPFITYPTPLFDATGKLTGAVNMLVDVSQRRRAEQDKQRLAAIVDSSEDAIISKDLRGIIRSWNHGAEQLYGYSKGEVIGKSIALVIPPHLRDEESSILDRLVRGERIEHFETTRMRKDGTLVSISLTISPVRNARGGVVGASTIARDITERKRAELDLAEQTLQLALAESAALVGSVAYDVESGRMQISAGYAAIHGFPKGTSEIMRGQWEGRVHREDRARLAELRNHVFRSRLNDYSVDYRIVRPDGDVRWIDARLLVSYRDDGHPHRVVGINIDVTERKRAQEHERALHAELDHRVKNILATVSTVAARTMDASSSMHQFVASLDGRIRSMARTHELLSAAQWQGISVLELVRRELAPYATEGNTEINGSAVILKAEAGQAMGMVLHELVTNAAKYGALSTENGRVSIRWEQRSNGEPRSHLFLEWREFGGPPVSAPKNSGFGTSTIRGLIPYEFGGTVDLVFAPAGVQCRLELPADWLINNSEPLSQAIAHASLRTGNAGDQ
jgi:PAS domain S-box-containing protein